MEEKIKLIVETDDKGVKLFNKALKESLDNILFDSIERDMWFKPFASEEHREAMKKALKPS